MLLRVNERIGVIKTEPKLDKFIVFLLLNLKFATFDFECKSNYCKWIFINWTYNNLLFKTPLTKKA